MQPFSSIDVDRAILSLQKVASEELSWSDISEFISSAAHKPHKEWNTTEESAKTLATLIGCPDDAHFQFMFQRVLEDGNWDNAVKSAEVRSTSSTKSSTFKPWVVLVTGVNGIRKTTSVYQPWFKKVLRQALAGSYDGSEEELPDGNDSFFRQLDYMIATLANEEFHNLYAITDLKEYSKAKADIFTRYRTLSEALGILLVKEAIKKKMNIMIETSGRDIAMFHYINHLFPSDSNSASLTAVTATGTSESDSHTHIDSLASDKNDCSSSSSYRKLVIHFSINDLSHAEQSVDARMLKEMKDGQSARSKLNNSDNNNDSNQFENVRAIINANAGGPYGSEVLKGVQTDSDAVWATVSAKSDTDSRGTKRKHEDSISSSSSNSSSNNENVAHDWYKASILIEASAVNDWCVSAAGSTTTKGTSEEIEKFPFIPPKK